jgi:hypothetical protein
MKPSQSSLDKSIDKSGGERAPHAQQGSPLAPWLVKHLSSARLTEEAVKGYQVILRECGGIQGISQPTATSKLQGLGPWPPPGRSPLTIREGVRTPSRSSTAKGRQALEGGVTQGFLLPALPAGQCRSWCNSSCSWQIRSAAAAELGLNGSRHRLAALVQMRFLIHCRCVISTVPYTPIVGVC